MIKEEKRHVQIVEGHKGEIITAAVTVWNTLAQELRIEELLHVPDIPRKPPGRLADVHMPVTAHITGRRSAGGSLREPAPPPGWGSLARRVPDEGDTCDSKPH